MTIIVAEIVLSEYPWRKFYVDTPKGIEKAFKDIEKYFEVSPEERETFLQTESVRSFGKKHYSISRQTVEGED